MAKKTAETFQDDLGKSSGGRGRRVLRFINKLIGHVGTILDEVLFTPGRDLQVFWARGFMRFIAHPLSFIELFAVIPLLFKYWNKSKTTSLSAFMGKKADDLDNEDARNALTDKLNEQLKNSDRPELRAVITRQTKTTWFFKKSSEYVLKFQYQASANNFLGDLSAHNETKLGDTLDKVIQAAEISEDLRDKLQNLRGQALSKDSSQDFCEWLMLLAKDPKSSEKERQLLLQLMLIGQLFKFPKKEENLPWYTRLGAWLLNEAPTNYSYRTDITLAEARKLAKKQYRGLTVRNTLSAGYDFAMNASFNFWLAFYISDVLTDQQDVTAWTKWIQLGVVIAAAGLTTLQGALGFSDLVLSSKDEPKKDISIEDDELAHDLLRKLYVAREVEAYKSWENKVVIKPLSSEISSILNPSKTSTKIDKQLEAVREESKMPLQALREKGEQPATFWTGFKYWSNRFMQYFFTLLGYAVGTTFIPWFLNAILVAAHVSFAAVLLSNPVTAAALGVGLLIGLVLIIRDGRAHKQEALNLKKQLKEIDQKEGGKPSKLEALNDLILQNEALETFWIKAVWKKTVEAQILNLSLKAVTPAPPAPPLIIALQKRLGRGTYQDIFDENLKISDDKREALLRKNLPKIKAVFIEQKLMPRYVDLADDQAFRHLKQGGSSVWQALKKLGNRALVFIGKAGSGILFARSVVFLGLSAAAAFGLAGIAIACVAGAIWAGLAVYDYHRKSGLEVSKRTLDQIDERLALADAQHESLKKLLGYQPELSASNGPGGSSPEAEQHSVPGAQPEVHQVREAELFYHHNSSPSSELGSPVIRPGSTVGAEKYFDPAGDAQKEEEEGEGEGLSPP